MIKDISELKDGDTVKLTHQLLSHGVQKPDGEWSVHKWPRILHYNTDQITVSDRYEMEYCTYETAKKYIEDEIEFRKQNNGDS